ncbi:hypothetical protein I7I53_11361 [Histoplasma capsulatum var. duboisii H88]|uniref:Uncharacterized protein n=1 Tax=Ajellomyces capsulatus (strain H88) TaxID=544711 RepID=A0A8A1LFR3_AJEC8|nr:hypothetical protein I7I53_11361 [Histoplasma capsulatum var. duboisii H88]
MSFPRTVRFPFLDFSTLSSKYLHPITKMARMVFELSTIYIIYGSNQLLPLLSAPPQPHSYRHINTHTQIQAWQWVSLIEPGPIVLENGVDKPSH